MKRSRLPVLAFLAVLILDGCGAADLVDNPPEFVEMHLDPASDVTFLAGDATSSFFVRRANDTTTETTEEVLGDTVYDGSFYSETDFEVIVVTNGPNYDLLYSVELTDSFLGACVYTNQSTLYHATSTIEVANDGSYTTTVVLTVPGSTDPETYLTERTISLTKILFSRDTVDGTFPAEIPENATTVLLFEVHSREYFDTDIGLPLRVADDGKVDVVLTPDSPYYDAAVALGKTTVVLPATVNGYDIGSVFLKDLDWIETLSLAGAGGDVFLLGEFTALTTLDVSSFSFPGIVVQLKHLTLAGAFTALTGITLDAIDRYDFFLGSDPWTDNADYLAYVGDAVGLPYDFPVLSTLVISGYSRMGTVRIGADTRAASFPSLTSVAVTDSYLDQLEVGEEANAFAALSQVTVTDTNVGTLLLGGTKPAENPAATLALIGSEIEYGVEIEGSVFDAIIVTDSTLGALAVRGGSINASRLTGITFQNSTFGGDGNRLFAITGSHPALTSLALSGFAVNNLQIGGIGSIFASLESISLTGITAYNLYLGDRDADFSALENVAIDTATVTAMFRIGGENVTFPELAEIAVTNSSAATFEIAAVDLDSLVLIIIDGSDFTGAVTISGTGTLGALSTIVAVDVTCLSFAVYGGEATYDLYVDDLVSTHGLFLGASQCRQIYVSETDPSAWAYYDDAVDAGIPVLHGTYVPA